MGDSIPFATCIYDFRKSWRGAQSSIWAADVARVCTTWRRAWGQAAGLLASIGAPTWLMLRAESSFDLVCTNSALNLMRDPVEALRQVMRVLKPGGLFACRTVLATMPRDEGVVEQARAIGNAVQAAPHRRTFAAWLGSAGFDMAQFDNVDQGGVAVDAGVREGEAFPIVETDERTSFVLVDAFVRKDDGIDRYSESLTKDISEFR